LKTQIKVKGEVELILQNPDGKVVERKKYRNTIDTNLFQALANALADGTVNFGIDDLFTTNAATGGAEDGNDGMALSDGNDGYTCVTTLDSGGDGTEVYAKFKGVYTASGAYSVTTVYLGRALDWIDAATPFSTSQFAYRSASVTMASGQVLTIYWTITFS